MTAAEAPPPGVPFLDLTREHAELEEELTAAFLRVLRSGRFILGPEVESFEAECAAYLGAKHAIGVSSGTDALLVALMALGVRPGDEVICPAYGFVATPSVICRLGATPVFVDILPCCFNIDPGAIESRITSKTKCIIPVHLFGQCAHMDAIMAISAASRVPVVEDAAQSFGATHAGRRAGTIGAMGCFSFFPSKNLGALGDGGMVCTNDSGLAERARMLRSQGASRPHHHELIGGNFRLDALQAAFLRVKLRDADSATADRRALAKRYSELLAGVAELKLPSECDRGHVYNQFVVSVNAGQRDRLKTGLEDLAIASAIYYPTTLSSQPCFGRVDRQYPCAVRATASTLALPMFPTLSTVELGRVTDAIVAVARKIRQTRSGGPDGVP